MEVHGNIKYMRCMKNCDGGSLLVMPKLETGITSPSCTKCGGPVRPHILMFDEQYDKELKN